MLKAHFSRPLFAISLCAAANCGHGASPAPAAPVRANIEQRAQGTRPALAVLASFDGLGVGFTGTQTNPAAPPARNPSDNSLAVGPNHIVQIVNSRMAIYTKKGDMFATTGRVVYGAVPTNTLFAGFGGRCQNINNGDAVVRYDQLAQRWLYVMPIFRRDTADAKTPYSMCYAISTGPDPQGPYYRYEFKRALFPDYPRPAVWPDGYYNPSSTGDEVIQKHACVAEREKMLAGKPAREKCFIVEGVNFLNNADVDGTALPPAGAPNVMMAAGGTQLKQNFEDDGIYVWKFYVNWADTTKTHLEGPVKIPVAPYHYLCDGQLSKCVTQPDTNVRLDSQGDKLMQRLVYRNVNGHESILAVHSVNTAGGTGGVRWYEFRVGQNRTVSLYQQGTYAPDGFYRWMASPGMDARGNIVIAYSYGGVPAYPGQRFAARLEGDAPGTMSFHESVIVNGEAAQKNATRWQDYTTTAMDPSDNCTFWYVGDYIKTGAAGYSTKIASFKVAGCGNLVTDRGEPR